jgi:hypothetical protein
VDPGTRGRIGVSGTVVETPSMVDSFGEPRVKAGLSMRPENSESWGGAGACGAAPAEH